MSGTGIGFIEQPAEAMDAMGSKVESRRRMIDAGVAAPLIGDFHYNGHLLLTRSPACAAALDKYRFLRNAYLKNRRYQVYDGKPPPDGYGYPQQQPPAPTDRGHGRARQRFRRPNRGGEA